MIRGAGSIPGNVSTGSYIAITANDTVSNVVKTESEIKSQQNQVETTVINTTTSKGQGIQGPKAQ